MSGEGWFVVNEANGSDGQGCKAILGYRNILTVAATGGLYAGDIDAAYPLDNLFDDSYQTEFSPDDTTSPDSIEIIFTYGGIQPLDYFAFMSKNSEESELAVTVSVMLASTMEYEEVATFNNIRNGVPAMVYFGLLDAPIDCMAVKIEMAYTSKPFITTFYCGRAVAFPKTFSIGAQPAHLSCVDEVRQFDADEGLNLVGGRRLSRGYQFSGTINFVRMDFVESFWREYSNHVLNSKPFFLMWSTDKPGEVIFGASPPAQLHKPKYKTSLFSELSFDVRGWA